jgi:hypothetical protein
MARIRPRGASSSSPYRDEADFKRVLSKLTHNSSEVDVASGNLYLKFGSIVTKWLDEQSQIDASPVGKALRTVHKDLHEVDRIFSAHDTGFQNAEDMEVVSQLRDCLAKDKSVGSPEAAWGLITSFRENARQIAHLSLVAAANLASQRGPAGRPGLDWYDDFTAILLEIAKKAGIEPKLWRDRETGTRGGWLLEAALALEEFLYPDMRSETDAACSKRLERSVKRLKGRYRQNR